MRLVSGIEVSLVSRSLDALEASLNRIGHTEPVLDREPEITAYLTKQCIWRTTFQKCVIATEYSWN